MSDCDNSALLPLGLMVAVNDNLHAEAILTRHQWEAIRDD